MYRISGGDSNKEKYILHTDESCIGGSCWQGHPPTDTSITETSYKGAELFVTNSKHYTKLSPVNYLRDSRLLTALQPSENCSFICGDDWLISLWMTPAGDLMAL